MTKGQTNLFDDEVVKPPEPDECPADVVFAYLRSRIIQTRFDLGLSRTGPRVLGKTERRNILARIEEHGGGQDGILACKQVIDVDEADCRRGGKNAPSWAYWNTSTPFRNPANFEQRLARWREDGEHVVFGGRSQRPSSNLGGFAYVDPDEHEELMRAVGMRDD